MKKCVYCGDLIGDSATKCFSCGKEQPYNRKEACSYRCRECGEPLERASDTCRKCGGDAESIRPYNTDTPYVRDETIGCLGYGAAIIFTPLSCVIAIICFCSSGSEKAKKIAEVGAIAFLCISFLRILLAILL